MSDIRNTESQSIKKSLKTTSLFGGVQVFNILVQVIRNKFVALLIGPVGVGVVALYSATINLIKTCTDFSLQVSAVRDISIAHKSGDANGFSHKVTVFSRIVWFTGLLGLAVCLLGSPLWSKLTFGDYSYTLGFALLSVVLLLRQLQTGKTVILQGTEHYRYIAHSSVIGSVLGLVTTVPIYYFWKLDGIVAVLIISAASAYILAFYYTSKLKIKYSKVSTKQVLIEGKDMLRQGILLSVNALSSTLIFYILRVFITDKGGVAELGLYSASFAIINTYVGMVFQAMSQEYYPRISSLSNNEFEFNKSINNQIYLSLLLIGPLVAIFLTFSDQLLILLYSQKFTGATTLMALSMLGVILQAPSWCMGYAFLAKGDNKAFLIYETIAKTQKIVTDIAFYLLWGLTGLGLSFILSFLYYTLQCAVVCRKRYGLVITRTNMILIISNLILGSVVIASLMFLPLLSRICVGMIIVIISGIVSYKNLSEVVDIKAFVLKVLKKK